ncbi:ferroxidase fet3 [Coemansia sp. BCRC 34490]|nr:ferroxidase fet3 [Coemansia sp. BCRC 34490]
MPPLLQILLLLLPALGARVEYDWEISNIRVNMDGSHERLAVAVNGAVPMPLVTAQTGDTLVLRLRNSLDTGEATGLHAHGILNNGTNYYDGAGMITECGVAPNSSFAYEIPLTQAGTFWLHGHHGSQYVNGLRGALVITDPAESLDYDDDFVMTFEDWFPRASEPVPGMRHASVSAPASASASAALPPPSERYPIGVINGANGASAPDLPFARNATYRLRLLNTGSTSMFRFAIADHDMRVIEADGISTEPRFVDSVVLGVAQRVSVLVSARADAAPAKRSRYYVEIFSDVFPELPGFNPRLYSGAVVYAGDGNDGDSDIDGSEDADDVDDAIRRPAAFDAPAVFDDLHLVPLDRMPLLPPPDVTHDVIVSANRSKSDLTATFINGISFMLPRVPSIFTALGSLRTDASATAASPVTDSSFGRRCNAKVFRHLDVIELFVANTDSVTHPMHLHGHFFQIVERGMLSGGSSHNPMAPSSSSSSSSSAGHSRSLQRQERQYPMRRDTVLVGPGSFVRLRFRADNPGVWMFHCHIERHMELGLAMLFVSAPDVMRQTIDMPDSLIDQCRLMGVPIA